VLEQRFTNLTIVIRGKGLNLLFAKLREVVYNRMPMFPPGETMLMLLVKKGDYTTQDSVETSIAWCQQEQRGY